MFIILHSKLLFIFFHSPAPTWNPSLSLSLPQKTISENGNS